MCLCSYIEHVLHDSYLGVQMCYFAELTLEHMAQESHGKQFGMFCTNSDSSQLTQYELSKSVH